jgi:uncharacterized membrane protein
MKAWLHHPLHPALAHFPVAFWIGASVSDLIALGRGGAFWWTLSYTAVAAGVLAAALALVAGLLELALRKLPSEAIRWLVVHASLMSCALVCFMLSLGWRTTIPPSHAAVAVSFVGCALILVGAFCGGTLVYGFGVGVSWREERKE